MGLLDLILRRGNRLPRDQVTRLSRRARAASKAEVAAMHTAIEKISALPGLADVNRTKRVPKGFYGAVDELVRLYDEYLTKVRHEMGLEEAAVAGQGEGVAACHDVPMGVAGIESLNIYRHARTWKDFPQVAQRLGEASEKLFQEIQSRHKGKDPEKIRMTGKAVFDGRRAFAKTATPCPFLDANRSKCRIWDRRPIVCRMHHLPHNPDWAHPQHPRFDDLKAKNLRLPVRQQLELTRIDKRMELQASPFLHVGVMQLLNLAGGELIPEVGEAARRMGQDGRVAQRANRNVRHAKKFKKRK
ncbi:MAG: YkgJ family cysteine cluster protein [Myxococcales bacterium FL481]|nr:MAG: YkgJ family cysteine cluster protein [Myxococcales bacterium FL481]